MFVMHREILTIAIGRHSDCLALVLNDTMSSRALPVASAGQTYALLSRIYALIWGVSLDQFGEYGPPYVCAADDIRVPARPRSG